MTITEFLLARIAEDEADEMLFAHTNACASNRHPYPDSWDPGECNCGADDRSAAECEAKRRIVELHSEADGRVDPRDGCRACLTDREGYSDDWQPDAWPCLTMCALAAVYADHPDYDPEWTPRA